MFSGLHRDQYSGHVTCIDQSEASIQVTQIRFDRSEASIQYLENFQRCIVGENLWKGIQKKEKRWKG